MDIIVEEDSIDNNSSRQSKLQSEADRPHITNEDVREVPQAALASVHMSAIEHNLDPDNNSDSSDNANQIVSANMPLIQAAKPYEEAKRMAAQAQENNPYEMENLSY